MEKSISVIRLDDLREKIERETSGHAPLQAICAHNRTVIGELDKVFPLAGKRLLDLGASIHGFALEAALDRQVASYDGIDLDIRRHWSKDLVECHGPGGVAGRLHQMNAGDLQFDDETFDCLLTISTFEHFLEPDVILGEMFRVLRKGGAALVTFEPIWTASNGHHLHHFGAVAECVPPWSHLFLAEDQMRAILEQTSWPQNQTPSVEEVLRWIYHDDGINRLGVRALQAAFERSYFAVEWIVRLPDEHFEEGPLVEYVSRLTSLEPAELLTRGLSLLLRKPSAE